MHVSANLAYLMLARRDLNGNHRFDLPVRCYSSLEELFSTDRKILGVVIGPTDAPTTESALAVLRGRPETAVLPLFLLSPPAGVTADLADGVVESVEAAFRNASRIHGRLEDLDTDLFADKDAVIFRLLAFLYARPDSSYEPVQHWSFPALYSR